ncbi:MAG TPA: argininosuccinate lyase [Leptospiraceae bacterium]|nr:argininosuccinate lyase [Leptospiraceae bacterium]HMW08439.1 argininosuccinate lyase [Leptospiraceae bacterium]HMY34266.1 argininosuccinate lyase [Leptospiraceae bacterium]HMZ67237.1 argininosuccinate lyase [Leptospiraceae bacterium]HNA10013.1 argininosuccinate lyase [Leptospiraceae bacterium]
MQQEKSQKLWGGRFDTKAASIMERIGESISFDQRLYKQDITGSIAHAKNLLKIGILSKEEFENIEKGLKQIQAEIESGKFVYTTELEDIHMHIEHRLTELIGQAGKKLHTGRSRNDQVAQDVRLFIRDESKEVIELILRLLDVILNKAKNSIDIVMPGYTHLQVAQPIRTSHYLLSYFWAFQRDLEQILFTLSVNDILVLGSGALAGVNYNTDRELIQKELNFGALSQNSIDAVSQRDHVLNFLFAASLILVHASRLCEEIIIYSSVEFGFISLPDSLTTGSSIMPQKKNPDIAELIRGKSARVISNLNHLLVLLKGLPLAYNRDLQEDKISLFDSVDQVKISIEGITEMIREMKFNSEKMQGSLHRGFATATDLADFLVNEKKVPFREAHELVGRLVSVCVQKNKTLLDVSEEDRGSVTEFFKGEEYLEAISLVKSTEKKNVFGGTARERQLEQIRNAENSLANLRQRLQVE